MKHALRWIAPVFMMSSALWLAACGSSNGIRTTTGGSGSQWTWMSGPNVANQLGSYGTQGSSGSGNVPGGREQAIGWADSSGAFWLFGGDGYDAIGNDGFLNDLWKYNSGQWTWVSGSNVANQPGSYGMQGVAAPGNSPGGRNSEVRWHDGSGNLWLFGGGGYDSVETLGPLNDLWKYSDGE